MSVKHGAHDSAQQKWYCGYWMTEDEWLDIHDYAPTHRDKESGDSDSDEE